MTAHVLDPFHTTKSLPEIPLQPRQFRLTASPHPGAIRLDDYWLSLSPDLPMIPVEDDTGQAAGVLLGFPIDLIASKVVEDRWTLPGGADPNTSAGRQAALLTLGGVFLWICLTKAGAHVYPDAGTQLPCVWDRVTRSVGTTSLAILDEADYVTRFDHGQFARLRQESETCFPAGLTAHSGVSRLQPNHALDLRSWTAERFTMSAKQTNQSPEARADDIARTVQSQIAALTALPQTCALALTAGYNTRLMLACARPWLDQVEMVAIENTSRHNADQVIASRIAVEQGLAHRVLRKVEASRSTQELYLRRGGHCVADGYLRWHTSLAPLAEDHVFVGGVGGPIGQTSGALEGQTQNPGLSAQGILAFLGMQDSAKVRLHMNKWLAEMDGMAPDHILELAHIENQLGPGTMVKFCADPQLSRFAPLITYRTFAQIQALPPAWKRDNALARHVISQLWPDLHDYPYNTLGPKRQIGLRSGETGTSLRRA